MDMYRIRRVLTFNLLLLFVLPAVVSARDTHRRVVDKSAAPSPQAFQPAPPLTDDGIARTARRGPAGLETTLLGSWDFDGGGMCDPQGWTSVDITIQLGDYFHVDDFAGLGGGDFGRLAPLEGSQSLWCGARPDAADSVFCGYATLPGYGNNWDQAFCTASCLAATGDVTIDFLATWDSEPNYDYTYVEYDTCDEQWSELAVYDDIGSGFVSHTVGGASHSGQLRLRFHFVSESEWSDQDGLWDTDGAIVIDSLTVRDASGVLLATELFEAESVGDTDAASGNWVSCTPAGYGDFAGLFPGYQMVQEDPCRSNSSCVWAFIKGSTYNYACGGYPAQMVVPYGNDRGRYIHNEIWSPLVPWVGQGAAAELRYDHYRDHTLNALIVPVWHVRSIVDGCATPWEDINFFIWPMGKD